MVFFVNWAIYLGLACLIMYADNDNKIATWGFLVIANIWQAAGMLWQKLDSSK